ncbi:MAG: 2,3,4,5-tetrahydropyridine-2,6-dicarboxylate N-succinyltransferase, partial [Pseudomonadota bacterium]|nr:2,3,4,5-tetrahydropyridine-2,6-dicarboxylate N-succinyltransferase [Pseudomonadota bacterium]
MSDLKIIVEDAFERCTDLTPRNASTSVREAVSEVIAQLDRGQLRVAEKRHDQWIVNEWLKKAVLLSFR